VALRRWANWANRVWSSPPILDEGNRVVPVSLVDDSRALALPPLRTVYGISEVVTGVAAEYPCIIVAPGFNRVIRILEVRCTITGDIYCTTRQVYPAIGSNPITTFTSQWSWPGTNYLQSGGDQQATSIGGGTNTADVYDGDAAMKLKTAVNYDFSKWGGIHVLPTEIFVLQGNTVNTICILDHLIWEVCDVDYREEALFSQRRGNA